MRHPHEAKLLAYLDRELDAEVSQQVEGHLAECEFCRLALAEWHRLRDMVRAGCPSPDLFRPEGEFWARLASACALRPGTWPLLPYLAPILISTAGVVVQVLLSLVFAAHMMVGFGLIPPPGPVAADAVYGMLSDPLLESTLFRLLGWSGEEVRGWIAQHWSALSGILQPTMILWSAILVLGILLMLVLALDLWWVLCWTRPTRFEHKGEVLRWNTDV